MNIIFNQDKLLKLLKSFTTLMDVKLTLMNDPAHELLITKGKHPFCVSIQNTEIGAARCLVCDKSAIDSARMTKRSCVYYCHAGLVEACFPVIENGIVISYLMFGQILDDAPIEEQWQKAKELCSWYPDIDMLRESFFTIKQVSRKEIDAYADIVSACMAYVWLSELVKSSEPSHAQRILAYIENNYTSKITLDEMSLSLSLGKTMLCSIAKNQLGTSIGELVLEKRVAMAKSYFETTEMPVSQIAEKVGVNNYNYFTKIFKTREGMTPSAYRKSVRKTPDSHTKTVV